MTLKQCTTKDGKQGWKWGDKGTCYVGKQAKAKALRDGQQAVEAVQEAL